MNNDDEIAAVVLSEITKETQARFRFILDRAIAHILDSSHPELAAWQIAFALGCPICMGKTMSQVASELGFGKATVSKGATAFCRQTDIEPSAYMLSKEAQSKYQLVRHEQESHRS